MARKGTARRAKGEGAYWFDGKRHYYRFQGRTVADSDRQRAAAKLEALKEEVKKGLDRVGTHQLLREFLAYWLEDVIRRDVAESTYVDYHTRIAYYITPTLGDYRLCDLTPKLIRAWMNALRDAGRALSIVKQCRAILERALEVAVTDKLIEDNPAAAVKPPKAVRTSDDTEDEEGRRALSVEQTERILADVKAHDKHQTATTGSDGRRVRSEGMYLLYMLAFTLGLRRGEVLGLRRKDIDLVARALKVRQQVIRLEGKAVISSRLKTPAARRDLPLTSALITLLRPHLLRLEPGDDSLLFPDKAGKELNPSVVTKHFARTLKRLGVTGYHFHDTRHTAITRWREKGIDIEVVAALAGHEEVKTSAQTYSDPHMERRRKAVEG